jgi:metallopeptidase MepB
MNLTACSSLVFADDMFESAFAVDPMDPGAGMRYRKAVLEKGGSQDELKTVTDFLGRPPTNDALYKELGIA